MVHRNKMLMLLGAASAAILVQTPAHATVGYFQNGVSIRDKGMAGAGVANPDTPLAIASNPAGIAEIDSQVEIGMSIFSPRRQFTGSGGPGFTPSGTVKSSANYWPMPSAGVSFKLDDNSALGFALFGNGGMNTTYNNVANPACAQPGMPATNGVYCGGKTGVNLMQMFLTAGYARKLGDAVTIGVAPVFGLQMFKANGLQVFTPFSVDPANMTNNGTSTSTGVGARVGVLLKLAPEIKIGAAYQTKMSMSRFKKYAGLFEDGGKFDVPASVTAGVTLTPSEGFAISADYRHIHYEGVPSVSNSSLTPAPFGSKGGPGFGWKNVDEFKLGVEGKASDTLTLRAGASFNNNPVQSADATVNILAPGVSKAHFTAGARIATGSSSALDFAVLYSPNATTTGIEMTPAGPNPGHTIELRMHQFELGVAWTKKL